MENLVSKLKIFIEKRENLIKLHFGDNLRVLLNFPTEQEWYKQHIVPIDKKIISLAKSISPNDCFEEIFDVYSNEYIKDIVNSKNKYDKIDYEK